MVAVSSCSSYPTFVLVELKRIEPGSMENVRAFIPAYWSALDRSLRFSLKRLRNLSIHHSKNAHERDAVNKIMRLPHAPLMDQLVSEVKGSNLPQKNQFLDLLTIIGKSRNPTCLYGRKSDVEHSIEVKTIDGKTIRERPGSSDWELPLAPFTDEYLIDLANSIYDAVVEVDSFTKHLIRIETENAPIDMEDMNDN